MNITAEILLSEFNKLILLLKSDERNWSVYDKPYKVKSLLLLTSSIAVFHHHEPKKHPKLQLLFLSSHLLQSLMHNLSWQFIFTYYWDWRGKTFLQLWTSLIGAQGSIRMKDCIFCMRRRTPGVVTLTTILWKSFCPCKQFFLFWDQIKNFFSRLKNLLEWKSPG